MKVWTEQPTDAHTRAFVRMCRRDTPDSVFVERRPDGLVDIGIVRDGLDRYRVRELPPPHKQTLSYNHEADAQ